jgi:RNA polymerase sigma-70 factor (ECF subfamily)
MGAYERGRAAWPSLRVDREAFAAHLARLAAADDNAEDLYLAYGCAVGDAAALAIFEARFIAEVPRLVARLDSSPTVADETRQVVREYLLVADVGARPRIAEYSGRGPLIAWLRVIANRVVLQMKRKGKRLISSDGEAADRLAAAEPNPEVALMRKLHGAELASALRAAIAALPDRDRALIKLSVIDELGIDALCGLYAVHRATVARWIARIKQQIFDEAVRILRTELALDTAEVESLCRAVQSQLDFSFGGLIEP